MSEQLAASSGEISTAMVKIASSAEQQVQGMEKADALLASLRQIAEANAKASARVGEARRPDPGAGGTPPGGRRGRGPDAARRA